MDPEAADVTGTDVETVSESNNVIKIPYEFKSPYLNL